MDLGIAGKWAVVCGASKGLGLACAQSLAREHANVVLVARGEDGLRAAAETVGNLGYGEVRVVAADLLSGEGRAAALAGAPQVDILVNNCGGPPLGDFRALSREQWIAGLESTFVAPAALIDAVIDDMVDRKFGRIVNISAALVKMPMAAGAMGNLRLVLTGLATSLARESAKANVTINNLLPGPFETGRIDEQAEAMGIEPDALRHQLLSQIPAGRTGSPEEFGQICAFLCSAHAGYLTRHNIVLDGGAFPGIL